MIPFVHLHVHSQYSILDGQASIGKLVDKAIADGMRGMALTDHGNMYGVKEFHDTVAKKNKDVQSEIKRLTGEVNAAREDGDEAHATELEQQLAEVRRRLFIPIFGCEVYVANGDKHEHTDKRDIGRHLILLAKNYKGYKNLLKIVSRAWTDGFYSHPRTDKADIERYHEGIICCSACLGGEVPQLILHDELEKARETILWFKKVFGDDYYLELQRHKATVERAAHDTFPKQQQVNAALIDFARELGIKLVCTNDSHFVNEADADAHERLICLSTGKKITDEDVMLYTKQEWFKTQEEMNGVFGDIPEALSNTIEVVDKVEIYSIDHGPILPDFPLPEGFDNEDDYLRHLVYEGAKERWGDPLDKEHSERLDFELETIKTMGFPGYFLIVQDYIRVAPSLGCSVGPGRGSAAGSAVAYCLGITKIDPLKYDLLFERFLNPERISLPDIDVDFDDDGRALVLKYVTEKYGAEKVAHIITYGSMAAKQAIKDVARVEGVPLPESNRLAKMIPSKPNDMPLMPGEKDKRYKITVANCLKCFPEFAAEQKSPNHLIADTIKYAEQLDGNIRGTGVHACGVIIGRDDITDWVPVSTATDTQTGEKVIVTQYEGSVIESTGLIKMDFLGLKTLSIIKEALENIKVTHGIDIDIEAIPIDDPKTYRLYCEGRTTGTFQFESAGMQKYLMQLEPSTFEDLIAMNALYRPGPMDYIPQFIARKQGKEPIVYDIPCMEQYLKDTYGITVYQEQVMLLSRLLGGFTRGQSDTLRKAMGKKQIKKMEELESLFYEGGEKKGHDRKVLAKIWDDWRKFASYAFNKSHATCYSWVAYQTAYLKANYPSEYMAAVLSRNLNDITKLTKFMDECKSMGIKVLGPDINESRSSFSANRAGDIRFGLAGISGVGEAAVEQIIAEREANGPFESIFDFVQRVNSRTCNRKMLEAFAQSGAFDCFKEINREDFFAINERGEVFSDVLMRFGQSFQSSKVSMQNSLFGGLEDEIEVNTPQIVHATPWPDLERLDRERKLVGIYLSAHPLDPYYIEVNYGCNTPLSELDDKSDLLDKELTMAGLVVDYQEKMGQKGGKFGIIKIEDYSGSHEFRLFRQQFIDYAKFGQTGVAVFIRGKYERNRYNDNIQFNITSMQLLDNVKGTLMRNILITLNDKEFETARSMSSALIPFNEKGGVELYLRVLDSLHNRWVDLRSSKYKFAITKEAISLLEDLDLEFKFNAII